jgi:hypothetical protein
VRAFRDHFEPTMATGIAEATTSSLTRLADWVRDHGAGVAQIGMAVQSSLPQRHHLELRRLYIECTEQVSAGKPPGDLVVCLNAREYLLHPCGYSKHGADLEEVEYPISSYSRIMARRWGVRGVGVSYR